MLLEEEDDLRSWFYKDRIENAAMGKPYYHDTSNSCTLIANNPHSLIQ